MTRLQKATPERLRALSDRIFAVLITNARHKSSDTDVVNDPALIAASIPDSVLLHPGYTR